MTEEEVRAESQSGLGRRRDRLELGAAGVFVRGDEKVRPLGTAHADSVVLAPLTTTDSAQRLLLDQAAFGVGGGEDLMAYDFVPLGRIVFVHELHARGNGIGTGFIHGGAGAFDKDLVVRQRRIEKRQRVVEGIAIAVRAEPNLATGREKLTTVDTCTRHCRYLFPFVGGLSLDQKQK